MGIVGIRGLQLLLGTWGLALTAPAAAQVPPQPAPPPGAPAPVAPPPAAPAPPGAAPPGAAPPAPAPPGAAPPAPAPGSVPPAAPAGPPPPVTGYPSGGPPAPAPPPPGYYYGPPPPPPPPPPPEEATVHTHDGFYLRLSLGAGWGQVKSTGTDFEATYKGGGWLMDILLGGTISNTVVIGGGFLIHEISNPDVEINTE